MKLYEMSWTTKNGEEIKGQLFTAENISHQLKCIEKWGGKNVLIKSLDERNKNND